MLRAGCACVGVAVGVGVAGWLCTKEWGASEREREGVEQAVSPHIVHSLILSILPQPSIPLLCLPSGTESHNAFDSWGLS
jgi:hypothetical protein